MTLGRKCCLAIADISIEAEVISMIEETVSRLGKLNVSNRDEISYSSGQQQQL